MIPSIPVDDPSLALIQDLDEHGEPVGTEVDQVADEVLQSMFEHMRRVRQLDERMLAKQRQGRVGFYGSITGQEAVPVAAGLAARPEDWVFPALRESAMMLVRGFPLHTWLAQVFGNEGDLLKGRQMPSHMSGRQVNQVSWSSCIASQLPHAVGAAMAARLRGDPVVALGFLGDGATSEGDFHFAMNFAAVYKAPCVFVCQNNHWAISVPSSAQTRSPSFAAKAHAYGMPGLRVDGNDVIALRRIISEQIEAARAGGGPSLIEAVTYRLGPHSSSDDPSRYREQAEVDAWALKDPLIRLEHLLRRRGLLDDVALAELTAKIDGEIDAALGRVEHLDPPTRQSLFDDVFASQPWHLREQLEQCGPDPDEEPNG